MSLGRLTLEGSSTSTGRKTTRLDESMSNFWMGRHTQSPKRVNYGDSTIVRHDFKRQQRTAQQSYESNPVLELRSEERRVGKECRL